MKPRKDPNFVVADSDGNEVCRVQIVHWWPGRKYNGGEYFTPDEIDLAEIRGTRWMTVAMAVLSNGMIGRAISKCCPLDTPSTVIGAAIAAGRLRKQLGNAYTVS